ncbi:hypothetical protein BAUCODRAFT_192209 [Baudoinia panamericana UAMH 10762]|uniref:Sas10 C-terminal domain-containing protein n=1 Tax=Baudoinia panamericana (strain UAMH 10762) TaxID=717646 RepID=M2NPW1_BAUPA|nr:uncharacterized protein BAUCODRAFT_192209 [Baudoinia panamericana UAMH 10762]EMD01006.1 hypothetical protein BAUCODRAFT_192209 [Baudoinia panamericana UAMH 10762]
MAKRKRGSKSQEEASGPDLNVGSSKKRIRTYEDVADSDDDFHLQRDKVLLGQESEAKRRRQWEEQEEFLEPSDEEVFDDGEDDSEDEELEGGDAALVHHDELSESEDGRDVVEEEDESGWGTSKADLYGADAIETEEQALEEEAEALRLQKKQLQAMSAADYSLDEADWREAGDGKGLDADGSDDVVTEILPQLQLTDDMGPAERLKLLKTRYPEFEPLSKELLHLQDLHDELSKEARPSNADVTTASRPNVVTKLRAASAYLGALTMYFALLTSTASSGQRESAAMSAIKLRDHPVMDSLVQCRELWQQVRNLPADSAMIHAVTDVDNGSTEATDGLLAEPVGHSGVEQQPRKSRAQRHAEAARAAANARKAERLARTEADLAGLDTLIAPAARRSNKLPKAASRAEGAESGDLDLGEEAPLTARELADKAQRKKSLRFYTSQIAQKANKRGASGRNAGGDEDVPYRERLKDRQARLNAEAEKRGRREPDTGADLGGELDDEDVQQAKQIRAENGNDDYYDLVAARTAKKKANKAALVEAQRQAAVQGGRVVEEETVGADGKRKITYAIEKNKGLTPNRRKELRNPRVKKRVKYEAKKKKLASMKPVYKGGEGRGGYGGELTGIKKGLVKSVKL